MIKTIVITALLSTFIIQVITITGIREKIQLRSSMLIHKLFSCDFCLSFWIAVLITLIFCIFKNDFSLIFIPFLTAPITKKLL